MKRDLLPLLECPSCRGPLFLKSLDTSDGPDVSEGVLLCRSCKEWYPVEKGIPRFVSAAIHPREEFLSRHGKTLARIRPDVPLLRAPLRPATRLDRIRKRTYRSFSLQWTRWDRWGWTQDRVPQEESAFWGKTLLRPSDLKGKVVMDAGCGNGRYAVHAAKHARRLLAVDLSLAAEAAAENLRRFPNVDVLQADLMALPLRAGALDTAYSIGVLMSTGSPQRTLQSVTRALKPGGVLGVHSYHKGNPVYEFNDRALRAVTTHLPKEILLPLSALGAALAKPLPDKALMAVNTLLRLRPTTIENFDWYATPVATHHTYEEMESWLRETGIEPFQRLQKGVDGRPRYRQYWVRPYFLVVKGRKTASPKPHRHG